MSEDHVAHERSPFVENYLDKRRQTYEKSGNFVAVLEAVPLTCPEWLVRALYSIIATEIDEGVGLVGRWSVRHRRDLVDFMRARAILIARAHGASWAEACEYAAEYFASTPARAAGPSAMMKSWHRQKLIAQLDPARLESPLSLPREFLPTKAIARAAWRTLEARLKSAGRWVDSTTVSRLRPRTHEIDEPSRPGKKNRKGKKTRSVR